MMPTAWDTTPTVKTCVCRYCLALPECERKTLKAYTRRSKYAPSCRVRLLAERSFANNRKQREGKLRCQIQQAI